MDDHAPAAARARIGERVGFNLASAAGIAEIDMCCVDVEQATRLRDVVGASAIGGKAGCPSRITRKTISA
jgi:hypothetical protein